MTTFDKNQWYHIYYNHNDQTSLKGTVLFNRTTDSGAAYFDTYDEKDPSRQWQFFLLDNGYYALRTKASGDEGFLGTKYSEDEETSGNIVPFMIRGNISDDSAYWKVESWKDGTGQGGTGTNETFFLYNKRNESDYHLTRKSNTLAAMTPNISSSEPIPGQRFSFAAISAINDKKYSTVSLPSLTATAPSTNSADSSGSSDSTGPPSGTGTPSGGLSAGAKAGIGIGVALGILILLVIGGLFLWKRHRRNQATQAPHPIESDKYAAESAGVPRYELGQVEPVKYEAYGQPTSELHSDARPAELPGEIPNVQYAR